MPSWLQAMLQANQGNSVPTWMKPPTGGSSGWPYNYPGSGGSQSTTGTSMIPRPNSMPMGTGGYGSPMTQATPGIPATTGNGGALVPSGGSTPPATLGGSLAGGVGGGLAGLLATLLGKTVQPQPTNSNEVPYYISQNSKMVPNPAAISNGNFNAAAQNSTLTTPPPTMPQSPAPGSSVGPMIMHNPGPQGISGQLPASGINGQTVAPSNTGSFLNPAATAPQQPSNGLDNTMLGLQANQNAASTNPAASVSPMAKLMALLQQNGNAASTVGGIAGQS